MLSINEHEFELNNEKYLLTWYDNDKPRLTKQGVKQKILPILKEYISKKKLPIQLVDGNGTNEVPYTLANKVLKLFSDNQFKIKKNVSKSTKLDSKLTLINSNSNSNPYTSKDKNITMNKEKIYLIPCSARKISEENLENKSFKIEELEFNEELGKHRKIIIYNLINAKSHKRKKQNGSTICVINNFNFNLTAQAYKLYSEGRFYNNNASCSLKWSLKDQSKIYIISALFGIIKADNHIPLYDLAMTDELNDHNEYAIGFWKGKLDDIIEKLCNDGKTVYNLLSENYKKCLDQKTQDLMTIPEIKYARSDSSGKRGKWLEQDLKNI
jgi:cytoplasmic iron level regulating protein YaaA (DUF328/UPF0246 family)